MVVAAQSSLHRLVIASVERQMSSQHPSRVQAAATGLLHGKLALRGSFAGRFVLETICRLILVRRGSSLGLNL